MLPTLLHLYKQYLCPKVKILNDSTEIMLEDLLITVSFLGNIFIRKCDSFWSTDGVGG
jgi:hypothetical protein